MALELRGYAKYLELLYSDRMDVYRTREMTDGPETLNTMEPEPVEQGIPCRISFGTGKDEPVSGNALYEQQQWKPTVFCGPGAGVRAGDKVVVTRCHSDGTVYKTFTGYAAVAGGASQWENHMEFLLDITGDA